MKFSESLIARARNTFLIPFTSKTLIDQMYEECSICMAYCPLARYLRGAR